MIKSDWDIFRAKFSGSHQSSFEWFSYTLFCLEFKKQKGIFRYKNQSAIETNPIQVDDEIIVWQAKFYDSSLSNHKDALLKSVQNSKRDYPKITKLLFYSNSEWGQKNGKKPQGLTDIEKLASSLNIKIKWNTASFFDSPFVSIENEKVASHFFRLEKSFLSLIEAQYSHSINILNQIQTSIRYNGQRIEIDRTEEFNKLKNGTSKLHILSGVGGVGKTAIIKKLFHEFKDDIPFCVFKASEFDLRNINELFIDFTFHEFIDAYKAENEKFIVIDSAEKLLDLNNTDPFKEILSILVEEEWNIIFTTRNNYLENLNYEFFEIYKITPINIHIKILDTNSLNSISEKYDFSIPNDENLLNLLRNPFYLNEYLKIFKSSEDTNYLDFKKKLWESKIKKSKPAREICFIKVAFQRVCEGCFFVKPNCESDLLDNELIKDGLLGYESPYGYFITHDIYEEWALEKKIDEEFLNKFDGITFFKAIGSSLPIRRAFRKWVSEKLLSKNAFIKEFIEEYLWNEEMEAFWKDEILISILLSDYSETYFSMFKDEIVNNKYQVREKISILLRTACKEIDEDSLIQLNLKSINLFSLEYILTKPRGEGWGNYIRFTYNNIKNIGIENISYILPIIHDWNSKFKAGEVTKFCSLIALYYYKWFLSEHEYFSNDKRKESLLETILRGSSEIKNELRDIFKNVLQKKWKKRRDPYYDLVEAVLSKMDGIHASKVLANDVLALANLYWKDNDAKRHDRGFDHDIGRHFGIDENRMEYWPASAYQTPIYWLLQDSLIETLDFILNFTNKSIEIFSNSDLGKNEVEEVSVKYTNENSVRQYVSNRIWCTYRGTQASSKILMSIHMALEKYLLGMGRIASSETLEKTLQYLLRNSRSASITAVISSIIAAFPEKTFNVAKLLFQTKEFFLYDMNRLILEQTHKQQLTSLSNLTNNCQHEFHEKERIATCDDAHRKFSLEHRFLLYQSFRSEDCTEEEGDLRQNTLWSILDYYYQELPNESAQNSSDKTWRMFLSRMDRRKMSPTTQKTDSGVLIQWNPKLDPDLKKFSEESVERSSEPMKYTSLKCWASYKLKNDEQYKQYDQYERDPKLALEETKEIIDKFEGANEDIESKDFQLFNRSIPSDVCAVLMTYHDSLLSENEKIYCHDIILNFASIPFRMQYQYQISDGVESSVSTLPVLLSSYPKEKREIKTILILVLLNHYPQLGTRDYSGSGINAIRIHLWNSNFDDANSLLLGYLTLKPKYSELINKVRQENYAKNIYQIDAQELNERFLNENRDDIEKICTNNLCLNILDDINKLELEVLYTTFYLIPLGSNDSTHKKLVKDIILKFVDQLFSNSRDEKVDYTIKHGFLRQLSYYVLSSSEDDIEYYLNPFLEKFRAEEVIGDLFKEITLAEDHMNKYDHFWKIWKLFKGKVVELGKARNQYYTNAVIKNYLFSQIPWKDNVSEWHTLKIENKRFFEEISEEIGHCTATLYAISKLLNDIGSIYLKDGITWISKILLENHEVLNGEVDDNTIYYLENLSRKFIYKEKETIKKNKQLKCSMIAILNFLVIHESVSGYIMRESIL